MYINRLYEILEKDNITITSLSKYTNIDRSTLGKYIRGYIPIPLKHLNTLCSCLHTSLDYILMLSNNRQYNNNSEEINIKTFITRLKEFRKENNLTQEKLANTINCSHSAISEYESGKRLITISHLYMICKKYHISADYLLGKTNNPKYLK